MVDHLRIAESETGKSCKIAFDLAGPKLRTGPVLPGPGVIRWKPVRNELGQVTSVALIAFCGPGQVSETNMIAIPVKGALLDHAQRGDVVELTDTRGSERVLQVVDAARLARPIARRALSELVEQHASRQPGLRQTRWLVERGANVYGLQPRRKSLDEWFVEVMGEDQRPG